MRKHDQRDKPQSETHSRFPSLGSFQIEGGATYFAKRFQGKSEKNEKSMVVTKYEPNLDEPTTIVAVSYMCDVRCRRLVAHCYRLVAIEFVFGAKRKLVLGLSKYFHNLEKEARMQ